MKPSLLDPGQALPPSSGEWPESQLRQLHLLRTCVSEAAVALLSCLPVLSFLDVRGTGVRRATLLPLERQFGLQACPICAPFVMLCRIIYG